MALKPDEPYNSNRAMLWMNGTYVDTTTHETFHVKIVHSGFIDPDYNTPGLLCGDCYWEVMDGYEKGYVTRKTIQD